MTAMLELGAHLPLLSFTGERRERDRRQGRDHGQVAGILRFGDHEPDLDRFEPLYAATAA